MTRSAFFKYFKNSSEIIRLAVMLYIRLPLSLRNVEDLLHERGIDVSPKLSKIGGTGLAPILLLKSDGIGCNNCAYSRNGSGTWMRFS